MKWILDKLKVMLVAAVLVSLVGPISYAYRNYLEQYWLSKSLTHTLPLSVSLPGRPGEGSGSGVITEVITKPNGGCTLVVLTAYHIAYRVAEGRIDMPFDVELINGAPGELLHEDKENDLALILFQDALVEDCDSWSPAEVAATMPPLGGSVWITGFPSNVPSLSRGTYAGLGTQRFVEPDLDQAAFVVSTGPGGSGGGIWYKGRLVSVLTDRVEPEYITTMAFGPRLKDIKEFLK